MKTVPTGPDHFHQTAGTMKDFSLKDLLIHVLHGGIVLFMILLVHFDFNLPKISTYIGDGLVLTAFVIGSYLLGLFLDPLADWLDTCWIGSTLRTKKDSRSPRARQWVTFPSYFLLKDGACRHLLLANNVKIRHMLSRDARENEGFAGDRGKTIKGRDKEAIWKNTEDVKLLFNYAKNRAFACAQEYQLDRIRGYFQLFVFYRNMMYSSTLGAIVLLFAGELAWYHRVLIPLVAVALVFLFYRASYKYRTYYCRMVLGSVYQCTAPPEPSKSSSQKKSPPSTGSR